MWKIFLAGELLGRISACSRSGRHDWPESVFKLVPFCPLPYHFRHTSILFDTLFWRAIRSRSHQRSLVVQQESQGVAGGGPINASGGMTVA